MHRLRQIAIFWFLTLTWGSYHPFAYGNSNWRATFEVTEGRDTDESLATGARMKLMSSTWSTGASYDVSDLPVSINVNVTGTNYNLDQLSRRDIRGETPLDDGSYDTTGVGLSPGFIWYINAYADLEVQSQIGVMNDPFAGQSVQVTNRLRFMDERIQWHQTLSRTVARQIPSYFVDVNNGYRTGRLSDYREASWYETGVTTLVNSWLKCSGSAFLGRADRNRPLWVGVQLGNRVAATDRIFFGQSLDYFADTRSSKPEDGQGQFFSWSLSHWASWEILDDVIASVGHGLTREQEKSWTSSELERQLTTQSVGLSVEYQYSPYQVQTSYRRVFNNFGASQDIIGGSISWSI